MKTPRDYLADKSASFFIQISTIGVFQSSGDIAIVAILGNTREKLCAFLSASLNFPLSFAVKLDRVERLIM